MTKLRVGLPPGMSSLPFALPSYPITGAALVAKSVHAMQSAPVGLLHAQLCIGGLVYSWDQSADGEGKET